MGEEKKKLKKEKLPSLNRMKVQKEIPRKCVEPDEWYVGEFVKADIKDGLYGPYIKMDFKLLNGQFEDGTSAKGHTVNRLMDATMAVGKEVYKWACVLARKDLDVDDDFNFTSYYGDKLRLFISDKAKKKGQTDGPRYQEVKRIKRKSKSKPEQKK